MSDRGGESKSVGRGNHNGRGCDGVTVTSSRHRALQTGQSLPEMQRRWIVWLHSDVTVAWPRPMAPWHTAHDDGRGAGGAWPSQKGFCFAGGLPANMENGLPLDDGVCPNDGEAKENGDAGDPAGTATSVSLHFAAQTGQAAAPDTQPRWKLWAHSDVNEAWRRPMSPRQASHRLLVLLGVLAMMRPNFFASDLDLIF